MGEVLLRGRDSWGTHGAIEMRPSTQYILLRLSSYHLNQKPCVPLKIIEWLSHKLENSIGGGCAAVFDVGCTTALRLGNSPQAGFMHPSYCEGFSSSLPLPRWPHMKKEWFSSLDAQSNPFYAHCVTPTPLFSQVFHIIRKRFLLPMHWYNTPYYTLDCSRDMRLQLLTVVYLSAFKISEKKIGFHPKFRN